MNNWKFVVHVSSSALKFTQQLHMSFGKVYIFFLHEGSCCSYVSVTSSIIEFFFSYFSGAPDYIELVVDVFTLQLSKPLGFRFLLTNFYGKLTLLGWVSCKEETFLEVCFEIAGPRKSG